MRYISTRGEAPTLGFIDVTLAGLARDGGLYVPESWPTFSAAQIAGLRKELASHPGSFVEADLKAVPEDAELPGGEADGSKPAAAKAPAPAPPK